MSSELSIPSISVCHILNINYDGSDGVLARRILSFLCHLEVEEEEDDEDDDEEEEDEDDKDEGKEDDEDNGKEDDKDEGKDDEDDDTENKNNEATKDGNKLQEFTTRRINKEAEEITNLMTTLKTQHDTFSLSFRDVEDTIRRFNGKDGYPINKWIDDYEEISNVMNWNNLQKLVFAKKSLDGLAKILVQSERGITTWEKLKMLLKEEFETKVSSAEIHKLMMNRKKKRCRNTFLLCEKLAVEQTLRQT